MSDSNIFYLSVALVFNQEEYGFYLKQKCYFELNLDAENMSFAAADHVQGAARLL